MTFNSGERIQPQRALFSLPTREGQSLPTSLTAQRAYVPGQKTVLWKLSIQCYSDNLMCIPSQPPAQTQVRATRKDKTVLCFMISNWRCWQGLSRLINLNLLGRTMPSCSSSIDWGWLDSVSPIAQPWKSSLQQNPGTCSSWALKRSALQLECASV